MEKKKLSYDPNDIAEAYSLIVNVECSHLEHWINSSFQLDDFELNTFNELHTEAQADAAYWNEEELKIKMIGTLFRIAKVQIPPIAKVFYERAIAAKVGDYDLAVICDCLIATSLPFNKPTKPYFFLQEFKKKRGEKNDPEGQLLQAMLISREQNKDDKPIYGGYLFGSIWNFTTLSGNYYCVSRDFNATRKDDLLQIVFILRKLKELILNR